MIGREVGVDQDHGIGPPVPELHELVEGDAGLDGPGREGVPEGVPVDPLEACPLGRLLERRRVAVIDRRPRDRANDLLVMDVGAGWVSLCEFLHKPIPEIGYPKANVSVSVLSENQ